MIGPRMLNKYCPNIFVSQITTQKSRRNHASATNQLSFHFLPILLFSSLRSRSNVSALLVEDEHTEEGKNPLHALDPHLGASKEQEERRRKGAHLEELSIQEELSFDESFGGGRVTTRSKF